MGQMYVDDNTPGVALGSSPFIGNATGHPNLRQGLGHLGCKWTSVPRRGIGELPITHIEPKQHSADFSPKFKHSLCQKPPTAPRALLRQLPPPTSPAQTFRMLE